MQTQMLPTGIVDAIATRPVAPARRDPQANGAPSFSDLLFPARCAEPAAVPGPKAPEPAPVRAGRSLDPRGGNAPLIDAPVRDANADADPPRTADSPREERVRPEEDAQTDPQDPASASADPSQVVVPVAPPAPPAEPATIEQTPSEPESVPTPATSAPLPDPSEAPAELALPPPPVREPAPSAPVLVEHATEAVPVAPAPKSAPEAPDAPVPDARSFDPATPVPTPPTPRTDATPRAAAPQSAAPVDLVLPPAPTRTEAMPAVTAPAAAVALPPADPPDPQSDVPQTVVLPLSAAAAPPVTPGAVPPVDAVESSGLSEVKSADVAAPAKTEAPVVSASGTAEGTGFTQALRRAGASDPANSANRAETLERIAAATRQTLNRGETKVRLLLHPPQLGSLRIDLAIKDGVLDASVRAESHAARHVLTANLDQLRDALSNQGIALGRLEVTVRDDLPRDPSQNQRSDGHAARADAARKSTSSADAEDWTTLRRRLTTSNHRVDVMV